MTGQAYRLKDICSIKSGKRIPLGMDFTTEITNYPYIRARDIKGGKIQTDDLIYIDEIVFNKIKKYIIKSGDIAITIVGASVGDVAYAQEEIDGFNLTENAVRLTEFNSVVDGKYLFYVLNQEQYHEYMQTVAGGAAQPKLGIYKVERIKVFLPPLNLQKEIASVLAAYDNLIENNNKRIRLLEQMAENLYKEWFVRFRFPGHEKAEFENGLPKGWKTIHIKDITSLKSGYAFKSEWFTDDGCCVAKIKDIGNTIMDTSDFSYVDERNCLKAKRFILNEGDMTIALTGATIGKISIVPRYTKTIYTNQRLGKFFNGDKPILKLPFLYCLFSQPQMTQMILNLSNSSSAQPNISPEQIEGIKFIGNLNLIKEFNMRTWSLYKQILNLYYKNETLSRQRDLLLPRLMSGKLEVKV